MRIILYIVGFGVTVLSLLNLIASSHLISIFASPATMNRNNMMMPHLQQQAQPEVLNMNNNNNNSAMAQLPLMMDGEKLNQNEMKNMLSSTANNNTNTTNNITGVNITSHFAKK
jgi:hypothetical protein